MILQHSPCYHCARRKEGCHSDCRRYAFYRKQVDKIAHARRMEHEVDEARRIAVQNTCYPYRNDSRGKKK